MKRRFLTSLALVSIAQAAPTPPKAIPVSKSQDSEQIPRAVPVNPTPEPPTSPAPARIEPSSPTFRTESPLPAEPNPTPLAKPAAPALAPATSPEDIQFDLADALFAQKQWDAATAEYLRFIEQFPASAKIGTAFFRIGEAHQKLGNTTSARLYYSKQLASTHPGPLAGIAAYKLAEFEFPEGDYTAALAHYKKAAQLIEQSSAKLSAQYFSARCLQLLGRKLEARNAFQALAELAEAHPFREASQFQFALLLEDAGRHSDALPRFNALAAKAQNSEIQAESATRAALTLLKLDEPKKALAAMQAALAAPGTEQWHGLLRLGILQTTAALGLHQKTIEAFTAVESQILPEQLPDVLALVANAYRQLKQHQEALVVFNRIVEVAPNSTAARATRYARLVCIYNLKSPQLTQEIDAFLATSPGPADRDNSLLMKAEILRSQNDFTNAGEAYASAVKSKDLEPQRRIDALLLWSACAVRSGNAKQTIDATSQFLAIAPDHAMAPTALAWRAETHRRGKAYPAAEKDYRLIIEKYPKAEERQNAIVQLALLRGEQSDNTGLAALFEKLLKDYPNSPECAQAHHWIGWAAFENRDYKKAALHLPEARKLDPEKYFESDSLRLIYCAFNLNDPDTLWARVEEYLPKAKTKVPADVLRWCAKQFVETKAYEKAEPVQTLLCSSESVKETDWLALAQSRLHTKNFDGATSAADAYLKLVNQPATQALGLLARSRAELGKGNTAAAQKTVEETLRLQPEGRLNGEARIIAGDIQATKNEWEPAAKLYASVAVAIDDNELSPLALEKAHRAYKEAGKVKEAADTLNRLQSRFPEYAREHLK